MSAEVATVAHMLSVPYEADCSVLFRPSSMDRDVIGSAIIIMASQASFSSRSSSLSISSASAAPVNRGRAVGAAQSMVRLRSPNCRL